MSHTALARRYRPRRFSEVATQEHVSETLRRAVSGDRVGHAYLFSGPRGVGKTTLARVLAMALNCPDRTAEGEPCGVCGSCVSIWSGTTSLDVVEIDAASNRGVDDARDLRSRAMYAPSEEGRFKVYIVDEAHMLTREAWNALLKVLEEPPPRVIFIFATTEPEKIEQTAAPILSRCQRFDFRRVGVPDIVQRLGEVLSREGATAEAEALRLVARKADGGMRDALSLTDQVLSLSDGVGLSVETVRRILGVVDEERFLQALDLVAQRDQAGIFALVQDLLDGGYDLVEFYQGLLDALRTLLRLRVGSPVPELTGDSLEAWRMRASSFEAADLVRMLGMAAELEARGGMRRASQPRILLELLLIRFALMDRTVEMETLLRALGGEAPPPPTTPRSPTPIPDSGPARTALSASQSSQPSAMDSRPTRPEPREPRAMEPEPREPRAMEPGSRKAETAEAGPAKPESAGPETTEAGAHDPRSDAPRVTDPGSAAARPAEPEAGLLASSPGIREAWTSLLHGSGHDLPPGITPLLRGAEIDSREDGKLSIALPAGLDLERLHGPSIRRTLEGALGRLAAGEVRVEFRELTLPEEESGRRVSQVQVREGLLDDLLEKEPGLRGAVESWDLDIVE